MSLIRLRATSTMIFGCRGSVCVGSEHLGPHRRSCPSCSEHLVHRSQCESLEEHELVGGRVLHHLH